MANNSMLREARKRTEQQQVSQVKLQEPAQKVEAVQEVESDRSEILAESEEVEREYDSTAEDRRTSGGDVQNIKTEAQEMPAQKPVANNMVKPKEPVPVSVQKVSEGVRQAVPPAVTYIPKAAMTQMPKDAPKDDSKSGHTVKNLPSSFITEAKRLFPNDNQTNAVAAYFSIQSGITEGLTDYQLSLVAAYKAANPQENPLVGIHDYLARINNKLIAQEKMIYELELTVSYLLFDRLGFRQDTANSPLKVNLLEKGVEEFISHIREVSASRREHDKISEGRPRRDMTSRRRQW